MSGLFRRKLFFRLLLFLLFIAGLVLLELPTIATLGNATLKMKIVGDLCEKFGEALIIAAILAAIVDPYLKGELLERVTRDSLSFAAGHTLPEPVKNEITRMIRVPYTRSGFEMAFNLSEIPGHPGFVKLTMYTSYDVENRTGDWGTYTIRTAIELPRGPELVPPEIAQSALLALNVTGPTRIEMDEKELRLLQKSDGTYFYYEKEVALPPEGLQHIHVETLRSIVYPENWFYVLDILEITIGVVIVLGNQDKFLWRVHFGAHGEAEHLLGRSKHPGVHLPGHFARITWTKRPVEREQARPADAHWPTAAGWLAGRHSASPLATLAVLGVPIYKGSITRGRCDLAPDAIRSVLGKFSPFDFATGYDLSDVTIMDLGNLDVASAYPAEASDRIAGGVRDAVRKAGVISIFGGDNSLTRPACQGIGPLLETGLLTIDAHLDLRDLDRGQTNGNPIRGLLEDGLQGDHIVQIGIQSFANSKAYARIAQQAGIEVITVDQVRARGIVNVVTDALDKLGNIAQRIYVDFDVDVLDRIFAPATPGSRPGGLQPSELFQAARCCGEHPKVVAIDIVEVDPDKDVANATILAAASCFLYFAAGYRERAQSLKSPPVR